MAQNQTCKLMKMDWTLPIIWQMENGILSVGFFGHIFQREKIQQHPPQEIFSITNVVQSLIMTLSSLSLYDAGYFTMVGKEIRIFSEIKQQEGRFRGKITLQKVYKMYTFCNFARYFYRGSLRNSKGFVSPQQFRKRKLLWRPHTIGFT